MDQKRSCTNKCKSSFSGSSLATLYILYILSQKPWSSTSPNKPRIDTLLCLYLCSFPAQIHFLATSLNSYSLLEVQFHMSPPLWSLTQPPSGYRINLPHLSHRIIIIWLHFNWIIRKTVLCILGNVNERRKNKEHDYKVVFFTEKKKATYICIAFS